ncbi:membrane-bound O-acyltransferase family protein [Moraxella caviae]|uniref:Probable alginate O-acetylase n=1 Tax=Moraxella caviae TaxID=34060 RepID=A0A1T0ACU0_9GAMM|nr:MBOAT family O-acyltransferase [Moraxella caviae]OOR93517.1 membrane-bound O-acyltransferase family protein [Moraxella caviae]
MVFSSLIFIFLFLPIVLAIYYAFPSIAIKNWILIISSIIFYAWGEPIWVLLLLASATLDYCNGLWIEKYRNTWKAKLGIVSTLGFNLGCLAIFKYSGFVVDNINALTNLNIAQPSFALPLGISFYVFMSISYTLDVWYGRVQAQRNFGSFLVYIANFHHLVAGPVIRYGHIAKETMERRVRWMDFHAGITRFSRGLFKKVFIANTAGALAEPLLQQDPATATVLGAWIGVMFYTLQIYFDFSGYSDMALGLGRMFGFRYHENFRHPYIAKSITDFWRRWHISLSSFFKDYVYIPLGGNRYRQVRNIMIVWMLTGFWHGASWNFVLWGLYFGILLLIEKFFLAKILKASPAIFQHIYALFFIVVGWAIFYFTDLTQLLQHLQIMFGLTNAPLSSYKEISILQSNIYWIAFALLACIPIHRKMQNILAAKCSSSTVVATDMMQSVIYLVISIALLVGSTYNPFIYFRF